jgi:ankyrin repeat protein
MWYVTFFLLFTSSTLIAKTSRHDKALLKAAKQNDHVAINKAIKNNAHLNMQDKKGRTALHYAQAPTAVHELIINGADLNAKMFDSNRATPLYDALVAGNRDKAITLILSGAKVNTRHHNGKTPLEQAIEHNDYEVISYLIHAGAHVTPKLITLAKTKNYQSIALLLHEFHQAHSTRYALNKVDKQGLSPMHYAILENNPIKLDALVLAHGKINLQNSLGQTPLHIAVEKNLPKMVERLVQLFAKIDIEDSNGKTPVQIAHEQNLTEIIRILKKAI